MTATRVTEEAHVAVSREPKAMFSKVRPVQRHERMFILVITGLHCYESTRPSGHTV